MTHRHVLLSLGAALLAATALPAQTTTRIDEGSFTLTRNGEKLGREEFRIVRQSGAGAALYVASATVAYDQRRLSPALRTDTSGVPISYHLEVRAGTETERRLSGTVGRGRFSARIQTPDGDAAREYVVADGALILDEDVFHQYFFLGERLPGAVAVVVPSRSRQVAMTLDTAATERVAVDGTTVEARHLILRAPDGERHIWLDRASGKVLRVSLPNGLVATRDEL